MTYTNGPKSCHFFGRFVPHASAPLAHGSGGAFVHDGRGFRRYALLYSFFAADVPCALRAWSPLPGAAVAALIPANTRVIFSGRWYYFNGPNQRLF